MNLAILGVAGAALVTSIVAVKDGSAPQARSAVYVAAGGQPGARGTSGPTFSIEARGTPVRDIIGTVSAKAGVKPAVRWSVLGELGIVPDSGVTVEAAAVDVRGAFEAINESLAAEGLGVVEYRLREGVLEVATRDYFDRRETTLVRYDIAAILEAGVSEDEFRGLVQQFVEPDSWVDNGGEKARMSIVAGRAFVQAPPRVHDGVVWFIEQLGGDRREGAARPGATDRPGGGGTAAGAVVSPPANALVYVEGAISRGGAFSHTQGLTLARLLIAAGGAAEGARDAMLIESAQGEQRIVGTFPLASLVEGLGPDPELRPGMIVRVR